MRRRVSLIGTLGLGLAFSSAAVSAETVEEVSKKIAAASEKLNSFSAKTKMVIEMKQEGFSMVSTTDGTTEMLRKGSDFLVRTENKSVAETNVGGNVTKQESSVLMIVDGSFVYSVSESAGAKSAQKMKLEKPDVDPFKVWRTTSDLKVLPDSSSDGRAAWVIEAIPKPDQAAGQGKTVIHYDKESGQMIKMITYTPDGKPMSTMTYSDIKINDKISPDRFVFKAPPGVEVQDLSGK
ncbi:MAG: outer membrane lipoprotein-sorting protein [Planctomycetota bacterium]